jgi:Tfp pilus assembly protein PilX
MSWTDRYRSYAAECVRLARQSTNPVDKALLLEMAESWIRRAERVQVRPDAPDAEKEG